jgi:hypothetical protein
MDAKNFGVDTHFQENVKEDKYMRMDIIEHTVEFHAEGFARICNSCKTYFTNCSAMRRRVDNNMVFAVVYYQKALNSVASAPIISHVSGLKSVQCCNIVSSVTSAPFLFTKNYIFQNVRRSTSSSAIT